MTLEEWLGEDNKLGIDIWTKKYQYNNETFDEWLDRVSNHNENVRKLIEEKKFIFGGRILANRGITDRKVTYSNCYVITPPEDNIESIFECASKLARTFSYGGGCGIDLSKLRPKGAKTSNAAKESTGPVSFMDIYSQVTGTISQNGRRGALMISIDINHPDVEEFIDCKTDLSKVNFANISVRVNDRFMKAVEKNEDYILRWPCDNDRLYNLGIGQIIKDESRLPYDTLVEIDRYESTNPTEKLCGGYIKRVKARDLFNKLVKNNWDYAEPGILYWDRISNYNILDNTDFRYAGVNPCAEEPLPAGGSCLLGSINLSVFVKQPFTKDATFDYDDFEDAVTYAVQGLNQVLLDGLKLHPLKEQQDSVHDWRQIGLGTFGLADCLIKMGLRYGSDEANKFIDFLYHEMAKIAVLTSLQLAKTEGCYPLCDKEKLVDSSFIKALELPKRTLDEIKKYGLFNSQLLTCAPTGTIGTMLETSTGVEPNFAFKYFRKTISLNKEETYYEVDSKIVKDYKDITGNVKLTDCFVQSSDINPIDRVKVQSILQKYIDASISSTVNLKKEATVEDVSSIYLEAWRQGLKGITIYRSGCKREGILVTEKKDEESFPVTKAPKRPKELPADLYTVKVKGETFIVLIGLLNNKPYEVFTFRPNIDINANNLKGVIIKKSKMHYMFKSDTITITELEIANENIEEKAATLYSSMLLRHGVDIKYIIKTAKKVNNNITSFSSAMCRVLSKYIPDGETDEKCPECGTNLVMTGGCCQCPNCGWSRCG